MSIVNLFAPVGWVLGFIMYYINQLTHNYGITLILFSVLVKIIMIPLGIKQQKGMISNARMQPKMKALQKAYGNNKQKYSEELQKLYNEEGFSPMSSCLPMFIQFPILFGMLDVIYSPIKHMLRLPSETISKAIEIATSVLGAGGVSNYSKEISVLNAVKINPTPFVEGLGADVTDKLSNFDFSLFGLFLGEQPSLTPGDKPIGLYIVLLLIPILSGVTSLMMSMVTKQSTASSTDGQMAGMTNSMLFMMPMMSVWISFVVPAGVGIYWLISNMLSTVQSIILNKIMNPAEEIEKAKAAEAELRERERQERIDQKKKAKEENIKNPNEGSLSQKEITRRKLAAARKRDAERYGEEFVEVTDEDVK
ncbi:YidC/Oxa1 family membrane protein insertase [Oscillospiraceae bacterium LTW-04]|nr:YidC/Oxa1 family membrane protein insertase [Oscillospiraceae bacterium MB24-C1]